MRARPACFAAALPPNLVWRSYQGGSVLRRFRALPDPGDNHFPEDWLASTVQARNGAHAQHPREGLSRVGPAAGGRFLADLLEEQPVHWLGGALAQRPPGERPRVLWKLLDSSVRLQVQAHPTAAFARQRLNVNAGKTECWYILGTRGPAHVYLGFQRPPTRQAWADMIRHQRVEDILACFDPIPVQPGDCFAVPSGTPHAIGAGVFMLELQEPTDWVVRCETTNAGLTLPPEACFMGLDLDACLEVFDYRALPVPEVRRRLQQVPHTVNTAGGAQEEELIGAAYHEYFRLHRLRGSGNAAWPGNELMLLLVLNGRGTLSSGADSALVEAGQTWLLPACVSHWEWLGAGADWEVLLARLPVVPKP
ncbi:MAG TPA: class I mannose-6-phosphate isomerase [Candidatus Acidoferrum sp.]|nr:class I mannose-6-phosphate isomerase [Candidatus Acidoferrum sp.]